MPLLPRSTTCKGHTYPLLPDDYGVPHHYVHQESDLEIPGCDLNVYLTCLDLHFVTHFLLIPLAALDNETNHDCRYPPRWVSTIQLCVPYPVS